MAKSISLSGIMAAAITLGCLFVVLASLPFMYLPGIIGGGIGMLVGLLVRT
jgi:hypothetical protein